MRTSLAVLFLAIAAVALPNQARATLLINDNFSTFASGNLVGQNGWNQLGAVVNTLPLQVTGGKVVIPGAQTIDNQDAWKNLSTAISPPASGTTSIFYGLDLTVNSAPVVSAAGHVEAAFAMPGPRRQGADGLAGGGLGAALPAGAVGG